ncbi:MAG: AlkZ family DNA glycosylase [Rikenellaceae bacterium]|nr:AlkZ family DNA glycosylase [Rikenellaceae bacterium]
MKTKHPPVTALRMAAQQLTRPGFDHPAELVAWMGAMQAQAPAMARWAVGLRLRHPEAAAVDGALARGEILRTHVMRPTWHLVAADDIRWMLALSRKRLRSAYTSLGKGHGFDISDRLCARACEQIVRMLEGGRHLTRQEIGEELAAAGIEAENRQVTHFLMLAENDAIVCSGADRGSSNTYALLSERAPHARELPREEALGTLARRYFRSHGPASEADFVWWSGLSLTETREAIALAGSELVAEQTAGRTLYLHRDCPAARGGAIHLLPAYDEYLIGYKDRCDALAAEHQPKAFNNWGIFKPVVLCDGRIVGNWDPAAQRKATGTDVSVFESHPALDDTRLKEAQARFRAFAGRQ